MRTSLRTIASPENIPSDTSSVISLGQNRPGPRRTNDYVDTPRAVATLPIKTHLPTTVLAGGVGGGGNSSPGPAPRLSNQSRGGSLTRGVSGSPRPIFAPSSTVVSQQPLPKSSPLKADVSQSRTRVSARPDDEEVGTNHGEGIMCERCSKCQCSSCTDPRPLPSHWCCGNKCEVSAEKALDVCTCFCCVKGFFYHSSSEEDNECYESPCGCCSTPHCCRRWTVILLMGLCLPCLLTYWPARGCLWASTSCYNRHRRKGCQCHSDPDKDKSSVLSVVGGVSGGGGTGGGIGIGGSDSKHSQTRRLLIESDSSSA